MDITFLIFMFTYLNSMVDSEYKPNLGYFSTEFYFTEQAQEFVTFSKTALFTFMLIRENALLGFRKFETY